jgi:hypothetical protein
VRLPAFVGVSLAALTACSSVDRSAGPSDISDVLASPGTPAAAASVSRPLSGTCTTVVTRLAPPPVEMQRIEYTCRISHLGLTTGVTTQTVDVATGAISSSGVLVAANGDELNVTFAGSGIVSFTDPTHAIVNFDGVQTFSGGTGRFADAEGSADVAGTVHLDVVTGAATGEFGLEGALTY